MVRIPPRTLQPGQHCQVWIHDVESRTNALVFETVDVLLEAPNWTVDGRELILNGDGRLWRLDVDRPVLVPIAIKGIPPINNDHVLDPDGEHIYLSAYDDWQLYRAELSGGRAERITDESTSSGLMHFLHGVSPDGSRLAFVGVRSVETEDSLTFVSAEIYTLADSGGDYVQLTHAGVPADGPEYSPSGEWIYLNTEQFSGHAQIARMRPDGSQCERLVTSATVDWFPHISPDGRRMTYLAYPAGTQGHPPDLPVDVMVVEVGEWDASVSAARLIGGQGTLNVNSWAPDSRRFAYVAYPID